ncbi:MULTISPECIES: metallophosphoesterase [Geobacillus]|uniref:Metallophosphoesterase n=1 Tax=Geobacillus zalihae TaxID=213419 RepID=A0A1V9CA13_9BACL|nr:MULTISPECIES: metallophosphoesterase [Geobacillus]KDE48418.1 metallophosphoesterase [Geobacillus sp. CAMR12739]AGE21521.1 putative metallophosphoesterase [Geobacillus sp. GHH01]OQP12636.1 metallophosphoesterase [Geobacillus zalihae]OQP18450.1 metallophosphoesterase [Geobacillus zalihae]QNU18287.1 metallophosphoesterase [Geobacillus zalihae]
MHHIETTKLSRRAFLKKLARTSFSAALAMAAASGYARWIEPAELTVTHHALSHPLIPKSFAGVKLLQFSDLHLGHYYGLERFYRIMGRINELGPDLVVFTGDLLHEANRYPHVDAVAEALAGVRAPLGKFCIYGNHDHGGYGTDIYRRLMERAGFRVLVNEHALVRRGHGAIAIAGSDDMMLGRPDWSKMTNGIPRATYTIALVHEPDGAIEARRFPIHVQLSGHSHGGQIQLPFIGPLITPPLSERYYEGFYHVGGLLLYVNRGLGTTRVPLRFFAPPELTVFSLTPG